MRAGLRIFVILTIFVVSSASAQWETWTGCRLVSSNYNDGDSFHVSYKGKEHIIRLYCVDCPETDRTFPERVAEQAKHHGVKVKEALAAGVYAKQFSAAQLSKPFTVVTSNQDARGNSQLPRIFGFITTAGGRDLGELLVENGLARSYGAVEAPPGKQVASLRKKYDQLEESARSKKVGVYSPEPLVEIVLPGAAPSRKEPESRLIRTLPATLTPTPPPNPIGTPEIQEPVTAPSSDGRVNINSASLEQLKSLPEVRAAMAQKIIDERPYATVEDIQRVSGIGPKKFEALKTLITCD